MLPHKQGGRHATGGRSGRSDDGRDWRFDGKVHLAGSITKKAVRAVSASSAPRIDGTQAVGRRQRDPEPSMRDRVATSIRASSGSCPAAWHQSNGRTITILKAAFRMVAELGWSDYP